MNNQAIKYDESDLLPISSLQHYVFCHRQFALIHLEGIWKENFFTAEGRVLHENVHDSEKSMLESGVLVMRSLPLKNLELGISGIADVVEFILSEKGIEISNAEGRYIPHPVEYKRGKSKFNDCDRVQVCAQALCLEEMLNCRIDITSIFYGEPRRRERVVLDQTLRKKTRDMCLEVHSLFEKGITPEPEYSNACKSCSIMEQCNPKAVKKSVKEYWLDVSSLRDEINEEA